MEQETWGLPPAQDPMPVEGSEGDLTLVAVFENIEGARHCARDLERRGIATAILTREGDGPEPGMQPLNEIADPGYGLSDADGSRPKDRPMGAGVVVGASIGATAGLFAATYIFPPVGAAFATGALVSTLTGAGLGSFLGGLAQFGMAAGSDEAAILAGQVRQGGAILLARVNQAEADEARRLIGIWNPLEIRVN